MHVVWTAFKVTIVVVVKYLFILIKFTVKKEIA